MIDINCKNPWNDFTGGADHHTIEEARQCELDDGEHSLGHVVLVPLDEYERLTAVTP